MRALCVLVVLAALGGCGFADSGAGAAAVATQKAQEMKQAEALKASVEQQLGHARELERDRIKALEEANR